MKHRLATIVTIAALVGAVPGLASATAMKAGSKVPRSEIVSEQTIMNGPSVPPGDDDTMDIMNAEHAYLQEVCPTVLASPARYDTGLVSFCHEARG